MAERSSEIFHRPDEEGLGELTVDRIVTVPNLVTLLRLLAIPLFCWLLFAKDGRGWAGFTLGCLVSTDWVDGHLARRLGQTSNFGAMFDPTVDRLVMVVAILAVIIDGGSAPLWFAWIVLVREVILSSFVVLITAAGAKRMDVTWWGKIGAFANMVAFPSFLLAAEPALGEVVGTAWRVIAYAAVGPGLVFMALSTAQYAVRGREAFVEGRAERRAGPADG
jgi:cardiolipin synthase